MIDLTLKNPGFWVVFWPGGGAYLPNTYNTYCRISNPHIGTWHMLYTQNFTRNSFRMLWEPSRLCRRTWWTSKMTCTKSTASRRSNIHADIWHMLYTQNFIRNSFRMLLWPSRLCWRTWFTSMMTCSMSTASRRSNFHAETWHTLYMMDFFGQKSSKMVFKKVNYSKWVEK